LTSVLRRRCKKKVSIQTASWIVTYEMCNIQSIHGSVWYITITVWNIDNGKIEVVFNVIESARKMTIGVKFEVNVQKMRQRKLFLLFLLSQVLSGFSCFFYRKFLVVYWCNPVSKVWCRYW